MSDWRQTCLARTAARRVSQPFCTSCPVREETADSSRRNANIVCGTRAPVSAQRCHRHFVARALHSPCFTPRVSAWAVVIESPVLDEIFHLRADRRIVSHPPGFHRTPQATRARCGRLLLSHGPILNSGHSHRRSNQRKNRNHHQHLEQSHAALPPASRRLAETNLKFPRRRPLHGRLPRRPEKRIACLHDRPLSKARTQSHPPKKARLLPAKRPNTQLPIGQIGADHWHHSTSLPK